MQTPSNTVKQENEAVETAVRPVVPLVSNQPERFGLVSEAFLFVEERRIYDLIAKAKLYAIMAGIVLSIPIIWRVCQFNHLDNVCVDVIKIIFAYVLSAGIIALAALFIYRRKIFQLLLELEDLADFGEDMARYYMPQARGELRSLNQRLNQHKMDPGVPSGFELAKEFWPVLSLVFKKEQNLLRWGIAGAKALQSLSAWVNGRKKQES